MHFDPLRDAASTRSRRRSNRCWRGRPPPTGRSQRTSSRCRCCYGGRVRPGPARRGGVGAAAREADVVAPPRAARSTASTWSGSFRASLPGRGRSVDRGAAPTRRRGSPCRPDRSGSPAGQTGIYPVDSPGGWHIIGRTPVAAVRRPPRRRRRGSRPATRVRFVPITPAEFDAARAGGGRGDRARRAHGRPADDGPGPRPLGPPGASGVPVGGAMDTESHRARERARRQRAGGGDARDHADRARRSTRRTGAPSRWRARTFEVTRRRARRPAAVAWPGSTPAQAIAFGRRHAGARAYLAVARRHRHAGGARQPRDRSPRRVRRASAAARSGGRSAADRRAGRAADRREPRSGLPPPGARQRRRAARAAGPHASRRRARSIGSAPARSWSSPRSDRMGYRLEGRRSRRRRRGDLLSMPTPIGSVQVPPAAADPADGRSPDDRRLREDRDRDCRRSAARGPARAGRLDRVRAVHACRRVRALVAAEQRLLAIGASR